MVLSELKKIRAMKHYKPIPEDLEEIYLTSFSCEPECCGAIFFKIIALTKSKSRIELWHSPSLYYDSSKEEKREFREIMRDAVEHYNLSVDLDNYF
jgi:hypothetical protein